MKIKALGTHSVRLSFNNLEVVTDPQLSLDLTGKLESAQADLLLFTSPNLYGDIDVLSSRDDLAKKVSPNNHEKVFQASTSGDYEMGGVLVRRAISHSYYSLVEGNTRVVYIGQQPTKFNPDHYKQVGDVDVLILLVDAAPDSLSYEQLEKVIGYLEPSILIPLGFRNDTDATKHNSKTVDQFIKEFGYANIRNEKTFKVTATDTSDNKAIEVVILD